MDKPNMIIPYVIETSPRGERAFDIYSLLPGRTLARLVAIESEEEVPSPAGEGESNEE